MEEASRVTHSNWPDTWEKASLLGSYFLLVEPYKQIIYKARNCYAPVQDMYTKRVGNQ